MTRAWIAAALLAGGSVLAVGAFQPANHLAHIAWIGFLTLASILLAQQPAGWPDRRPKLFAVVLMAPAVFLASTAYKAIPILFIAGFVAQLSPVPRRWPRMLGHGAATAGAILLVQSLTWSCYASLAARRHELPWELSQIIAAILRLLGVNAADDGGAVAMRSLQDTVRMAAAWELLLDPATVCFFVGGLALLGLVVQREVPRGVRWKAWRRSALRLLGAMAAWAVVRTALLAVLIIHRTLRADPITAPNVGSVLVNGWLHILLLAGPVLLAVRLVGRPAIPLQNADDDTALAVRGRFSGGRRIIAAVAAGLGVALIAVLLCWAPVGQRKSGRVMVVERHSTWEPTTEPYGTVVYGEAGSYNYAAIYAYCEQYYEMSRLLETDAIDDTSLSRCDVLIIKTPTARYSTEEAAAVVRFVERGGSLLLIGDHTNVFNMNTCLNDIARHFGFTFRNDLLFRVGDPYFQKYRPPLLTHPILQHVPPMNFAVSCSIDPGRTAGRMVIRNAGLWSLPPAYQESNYHPQAEYRPNMQYGAWCQLWSVCFGEGRVLGFGDSTLFSNFCAFQPGKTELLMGMLEWLNHRSWFDRREARRPAIVACALASVVLLAIGVWLGLREDANWVLLVAAGFAGWAAAAAAIVAAHRAAMPVPAVTRPMVHVVIDRQLSETPLFTGAFADKDDGTGYGLLEQWIPRIGNYISRRTGDERFSGDGLVIICPTRSASQSERDQLARYVESGGKVLVVDSIDVEGSTANSILWMFGLASNHYAAQVPEGALRCAFEAPQVPLTASCEITGGEPLAWLGNAPVAARARFGKGSVTALGFGSLFNDANMGFHWLPEPEAATLQRYEVLYGLLRAALPSEPLPPRGR